MRPGLKALLLVALTCVSQTAGAVRMYSAVALPIYGADLNNRGQVAGAGDGHAAVWDDGVTQDLGTLGEPYSWANGINDRGDVVGTTYLPSGNTSGNTSGFIYRDGVMTAIEGSQDAYAINNSGQVVGGGYSRAFIYDNGSLAFISEFGQGMHPNDINDDGVVVGSQAYGSWNIPFFYFEGVTTAFAPFGGECGLASAVNNSGHIVGSACLGDVDTAPQHAFLYVNGVAFDLGTLGGDFGYGSEAWGINNRGDIVGRSYSVGYPSRAFLYSGNTMFDLNSLVVEGLDGATLFGAYAINNRGQIIASATVNIGGWLTSRSYLLTPVSEPGTLALLSLGLMGLGVSRRRDS